MNEKFQVGDIVILKSGGPKMTVVELVKTVALRGPSSYTGKVRCSWFEANQPNWQVFPQDALDLFE